MMKPVLPGGWLSTSIAFVFTSRCCLSFRLNMGEDTEVSQEAPAKLEWQTGFVLSQSMAPLLYTQSMGRAFPGGTRLPGAPGSGRALPALGVGFGPSHTRSRTGVQPSFSRVQTQQHWTFHDKDNSSPGETYFSMYFSWTLWLLTRTKSSCCSITKDCLVSN